MLKAQGSGSELWLRLKNPMGIPGYFQMMMPYMMNPDGPQPQPHQPTFEELCDAEVAKTLDNVGPKETEDVTSRPILSSCATALGHWFQDIFSPNKIREHLQLCARPENAAALKPVLINDPIKKIFTKADYNKDKNLCYLCAGISKAASPLALAWSDLLQAQYIAHKDWETRKQMLLLTCQWTQKNPIPLT